MTVETLVRPCAAHVTVFRDKQTGQLTCRDCRNTFGII